MIEQSVAKKPQKHISFYAFLAMPLAFAGLPLYMHIPDYYTRDLGLSLAAAGLILMILRLVDAAQDPLIGYFSDKGTTLRNRIVGAGFFALVAGMAALVMGPPEAIPVAPWFGFMIALTALGFSMVNINFVTLGSMYQNSEFERQKISSWRESFSLVGMLIASILPPAAALLFPTFPPLMAFFIIFVILLGAAGAMFYKFARSVDGFESQAQNAFKMISASFFAKNAKFFACCFLTQLAAALPAILFLYFNKDYLGSANNAGFFLFLYFVSGAVFIPVWLRIARHSSAEKSWLIACLLSVVTFAWAFTLQPGNVIGYALVCVFSGIALGADLIFPPAIMGRLLQQQNSAPFARQAFSIMNALPKIALAVASGIAFMGLHHAGFKPGADNTQHALLSLTLLYALVPCAIKTVSAYLIYQLYQGVQYESQEGSSHHGRAHIS